jgi:hypothetical protein
MPLPVYTHGKVAGLFPDLTVVSERSETPMVCCGYCSTHMACITAKAGLSNLMKNEAHAIRAAGGRPHNAGSKASELRAGAQAALGVTLLSVSIADIPARLRAGFAVEVAIQYGKFPKHLKVQENDFGHSIVLFGWRESDDCAGVYDPLWTQGARGAWSPWAGLTASLWANGNHNTTTVRRVPTGGDMAPIILNSGVVETKGIIPIGGRGIYDQPDGKVIRNTVSGETLLHLGYVDGGVGWEVIDLGNKVAYLKTDAIKSRVDIPLPCPPGEECSDEDLLAAKQEGYDLALSGFPPRPA